MGVVVVAVVVVVVFVSLAKADVKGPVPSIWNGGNKMSLRFITPTSPNSIPKFHSNRLTKLCEIIAVALSHSCDLESESGSARLVSKFRLQKFL